MNPPISAKRIPKANGVGDNIQKLNLTPNQAIKNIMSPQTRAQVNKFKSTRPYISNICAEKAYLVYLMLNKEQRLFYDVIHTWFRENNEDFLLNKGGVLVLDAPSGTGKTTTISSLIMGACRPLLYVGFSNNLKAAMSGIENAHAISTCGFSVTYLGLNFCSVFPFWRKIEQLSEYIYTLIERAKSASFYKSGEPIEIILQDEFPIEPPTYIFFLWLVSVIQNKLVILVGDKKQQDSITRVKFLHCGNPTLVKYLMNKEFTFTKNMRQRSDETFARKINELASSISTNGKESPLRFLHTLNIFKNFRSKFFTESDPDALYLAQNHIQIKNHLLRMRKFTKSTDLVSHFTYLDGKKVQVNKKINFNTFIDYRIGGKYIYRNRGVDEIVVVHGFSNNGQTLFIRNIETKIKYSVVRQNISRSFITAWVDALVKYSDRQTSKIYQFPVKPMVMSFHAAQGLTITADKVILNLDAKSINAVYVGMTRVHKEKQILGMETKLLPSLYITEKLDDGFCYQLPEKTTFESISTLSKQNLIKITNQLVLINKDLFRRGRVGKIMTTQLMGETNTTDGNQALLHLYLKLRDNIQDLYLEKEEFIEKYKYFDEPNEMFNQLPQFVPYLNS